LPARSALKRGEVDEKQISVDRGEKVVGDLDPKDLRIDWKKREKKSRGERKSRANRQGGTFREDSKVWKKRE